MATKKVYHRGNIKTRKTKGEINEDPNLTVPGMMPPLRDLLLKYANGGKMPDVSRQVYHDGFNSFQVDATLAKDFDLTDMDEILAEIDERKKHLEELRDQYKLEQEELKKKKKEEIKNDDPPDDPSE